MDETKPLLSTDTPSTNSTAAAPGAPPLEQPPPYTEEPVHPTPYTPPTTALPSTPTSPSSTLLPTEQPPPYSSVSGQNLFVQCRVCQHVIHVASGTQTRVVKCSNCREATPIAPPPSGKKYVRCPCNCLLTCSDTASRVVCPRENCKRTIGVGTIDVRPINTDRIRVTCGKCHKAILWPSNAAVARCPHCRSRSYLYARWMRYRAIACTVVGVLLILIATGLTSVKESGCLQMQPYKTDNVFHPLIASAIVLITAIISVMAGTYAWAEQHGGIYVVWVGLYITGFLFLLRAAFYCCMTRSYMEH